MPHATHEEVEQLAAFRRLFPSCRAPPAAILEAVLSKILKEIQIMSQTQSQTAADVAQIAGDLKVLEANYSTLVQQVADLKAAADTGSVPAELQAQIDALHAFAQSTQPQPATSGATAGLTPADATGTPVTAG